MAFERAGLVARGVRLVRLYNTAFIFGYFILA